MEHLRERIGMNEYADAFLLAALNKHEHILSNKTLGLSETFLSGNEGNIVIEYGLTSLLL